MPAPNPTRNKFLKYLRGPHAHDMPWVDTSGVYFSTDIRRAMKEMEESDPLLYSIIKQYVQTRKARMKIADYVNYDSSTVKRKLDEAVDCLMHRMKDNVEAEKKS